MSDFLDSLVGHSLGSEPTLRPLVPSRFEPVRTPAMFPAVNDATAEDETVTSDVLPSAAAMTTQPLVQAVGLQGEGPPVPTIASPVRSESWNRGLEERTQQSSPQIEADPVGAHRSEVSTADDNAGSTVDWLHRRLNDLSLQFSRFRGDVAPTPSTPSLPPIAISNETHHQPPGSPTLDVSHSETPRGPITESTPFLVPDSRTPIESRTDFIEFPQRQENSRSDAQFEELLAQIRQPVTQPPRVVPEDLPALSHRATSEPTINVTIGRVEVKATREAAPAARPARPATNPAIMSLDDYLKRRAAGGLG